MVSFLEELSGAISPLLNKCCDTRQVGEMLESDERRETILKFLLQQRPEAMFAV